MQFNSVQSGSFLTGAKSINENVTDIYNTSIQTGFAADEVIKQANANDAVKKMATARRQASMANTAIDNVSDAKVIDIKSKLDKQLKDIWRPAVRMEGINRMAGSVAAGAYMMDESKKMQKEQAELKAERQKINQATIDYNKQLAEQAKSTALLNAEKLKKLQEEGKIPSTANPSDKTTPSEVQPETTSLNNSSTNVAMPTMSKGWQKLSQVLRTGEGTLGDSGYTTMFTGAKFTDTSKHPRLLHTSGKLRSDAAGAYQFLSTTWDGAKKALGLKDFSPASQEAAGRYLTQRRGVDPDKIITDFQTFKNTLDKLAPEWASMPYQGVSPKGFGRGSSYYGQDGLSAEEAWKIYQGA